VFITAIGTAVPTHQYSKAQCLAAFESSDWLAKLDNRAHAVARTVLQRDNGIESRHLAIDHLAQVFDINPNTLAARFSHHAPPLAAQAALQALKTSGLQAEQIDAVVVSTCTGFLCPGLSGHMVELLGLRADVQAFDLVGQGCGAALPNMQLGLALLSTGACDHVLSICVEVSSAAMYLDNDPGVIISACLFGDGAGAAVLSAKPAAQRSQRERRIEWLDSTSITVPGHRDALKFEQRDGMLRNVLTRTVPGLAADHAQQVLQTVLQRTSLTADDISAWVMHAGGRDVLVALMKTLHLEPEQLRYSADVLRSHGNLSSAFVYFVLQAALADEAQGGWWWLSSFGAGFSCHGALLKVS
jgi:predicted naringenin-chalcone synthase